MRIAYVTDFDLTRVLDGTTPTHLFGFRARCYYSAKSLKDESTIVNYLGPLTRRYAPLTKLKERFYRRLRSKVYFPWAEPFFNQEYAAQILNKLAIYESDVVVCSEVMLAAYLNCNQPIVLWLDTLYAGLINFYSGDYSNLCQESIRHLTTMDKLALDRSKLCIFSSDWAAKTAIDTYQVNPSKVKVVPSGANVECHRTFNDIQEIVEARPSDECKLLFLGTDWFRKGGDIALDVTKSLHKAGLNVELTVVGCQPIADAPLPDFVTSLGFIDKSTPEGLSKINSLLTESHFLIVPSKAETYGNVFCEANSFGVPCIATTNGGIPTIVKENLNGKAFSQNASIEEYSTYILDLFTNYSKYKQLALSAFNEYQTRLNWSVAGKTSRKLLEQLL